MKNNIIKKLLIICIISLMIILICNIVFATTINSETMEELKSGARELNIDTTSIQDVDINNITEEDILKVYDELTENYKTEEIAEIIENNKEEIKKQGVSEDLINVGTEILRTTDTETVREILKEDIDIQDIKEKVEKGYSVNEIVKSIVNDIPTTQKINIVSKLFFTNKIVKTVINVLIILFVYDIILRWIIYSKAGESGFAAIIPIYRDIVMYRISDISPWLLLLWFVPVFGWIILIGASFVGRICLAGNFGRGSLFAIGNAFCPALFESIIAFNPNIQYEE